MEKPKIVICIGSSCFSRGNTKNVEIAEKYLEENGYKDEVDVDLSGSLCQGHCAEGPIVVINDRIYTKVDTGLDAGPSSSGAASEGTKKVVSVS